MVALDLESCCSFIFFVLKLQFFFVMPNNIKAIVIVFFFTSVGA